MAKADKLHRRTLKMHMHRTDPLFQSFCDHCRLGKPIKWGDAKWRVWSVTVVYDGFPEDLSTAELERVFD